MKTVMNHNFGQISNSRVPRARFDRSHGLKTTFDAGKLVPIFVDEVLPGDQFKLNLTGFGRLATPMKPIMDNMKLETFFFFVPYRLVWDNFQKFMGERADPGDSIDYVVPMYRGAASAGDLRDYFGIPTGCDLEYSVLPFRSYWLIWNEWFRDQNLQDSKVVKKGDSGGVIEEDPFTLANRGKRHDYFTSCLPTPQKGDPVQMSLGDRATVKWDQYAGAVTPYTHEDQVVVLEGNTNPSYNKLASADAEGSDFGWEYFGDSTTHANMYADLSEAVSATINDLRYSIAAQTFLERDMRGGTRYTELIKSHFGVTSPDARLQRPEYLGGSSSFININPIAQTSSTDATTPQGNLSGFGTTSFSSNGFNKSFTEHGIIIGLANSRADLTYQQGLDRMWSRSTRFDHYWPEFANLGEQPVLNKEIYAQGTADDDEVFGYQERWAEYRYKQSRVTGQFRSSHPTSLDSWHLSQDFSALPVLNSSFIEDNPPIDRIIAVPSEPHFLLDMYFSLTCVRPIPMYSVPGFGDRF